MLLGIVFLELFFKKMYVIYWYTFFVLTPLWSANKVSLRCLSMVLRHIGTGTKYITKKT